MTKARLQTAIRSIATWCVACAICSTVAAAPREGRERYQNPIGGTSTSVAQTDLATGLLAHARVRVVVLQFDGPVAQADSARDVVRSLLSDRYVLASPRNWQQIVDSTSGTGRERWRLCATQARVDALVEGWVRTEGRHHVLTIALRKASTGQAIDTISVRFFGDQGVTSDGKRRLAGALAKLDWIDIHSN